MYQNYISNQEYEKYVKLGLIPRNFSLEEHNQKIIDRLYVTYLNYFKTMYQKIDARIVLDEEQIKAILCDEDYVFILAGAGTGKTTTMVSKVKYLVDIKKVEPRKILVISFTKKATEELEKRIVYDFGIPANVMTFHSLGFQYIKRIFNHHICYVVDDSIKDEIFMKYVKEILFPDKEKLKEIIALFTTNTSIPFLFGRFFKENYEKYPSFVAFFAEYKKYKLSTITNLETWITEKCENLVNAVGPRTIKNELVKSKKEALIANFLFENNIEYHYEKIYDELMDERKIYKPDFTLDLFGEEVYLEYFGINDETSRMGKKYLYNKKIKIEYHKSHHTKHIFLEPTSDELLLLKLEDELKKMGFSLKKRSALEIFDQLINNNPSAQIYKFKNFLFEAIKSFKTSKGRTNYKQIITKYLKSLKNKEKQQAEKQFLYIHEFYTFYQKELFGAEKYGFDYEDMIYYATLYMDKVSIENEYEYLIVDEYQDISKLRYEFAKKIVEKNHAKITAVGDDWQTIYSFAGSKIEYVYDFQKYYPQAKILKISKTYRNSQQLIDYSGNFIMKNAKQIKKKLISDKILDNPIRFIPYKDGEEYIVLKKLILQIHSEKKDHQILILARTNKAISRMYFEEELIDGLDTRVEFVGHNDLIINGMTMHKSKGLASDEVIIIGLNETFPSEKSEYWLNALFKTEPLKEPISYAEERRLFYVALTRTKNFVYLLVNEDEKYRSPFINEIYRLKQQKEPVS